MNLELRLERLEQRKLSRRYRAAIIMDDLIAAEAVDEDETILGLKEISWDEPGGKIWMRNAGESLSQLRRRVGLDMGCLEGELCLLDALRVHDG